ncbi:MAG: IS21 family transposase [Bacteroidaceae bacterium]|nr:IS21 family transposase [Bacteroidaceae bacterium]
MKGVQVYHCVRYLKSLGKSIRDIAAITEVSPGTVVKYLKTDQEQAQQMLVKVKRTSEFDRLKQLIDEQLTLFPEISSVKLLRILKETHPEIKAKERSFRKYLAKIRSDYGRSSMRFYKPIQTDRPGFQVQVDPGEDWILLDNHEKMKVYFVAFIFGFSRQRYFYLQNRPFNTGDFIRAHKEAFEFFGGIAKEYVYDQTKLVVISERYREVWLNEEFHKFALSSGFQPVVCEGYDPESKGKVERLVQYIKDDFLYGETFADLSDAREKSQTWLTRVNNQVHSATNQIPSILFNEEKKVLKPYVGEQVSEKRLVDKTGLISFKSNKYSVPYQYQQKAVLINTVGDMLIISDVKFNEEICRWQISSAPGIRNINNNHYRNYKEELSKVRENCLADLVEFKDSEQLINKIITENPKIQRDQLNGLRQLYAKHKSENWSNIIELSLQMQTIRTSVIEEIINKTKTKRDVEEICKKTANPNKPVLVSKLDRPLEKYNEVIR